MRFLTIFVALIMQVSSRSSSREKLQVHTSNDIAKVSNMVQIGLELAGENCSYYRTRMAEKSQKKISRLFSFATEFALESATKVTSNIACVNEPLEFLHFNQSEWLLECTWGEKGLGAFCLLRTVHFSQRRGRLAESVDPIFFF